MSQHFLLSAEARSLSLAKVARMSEDEAWEAFKLIRWSETEGEPFCPRCGCAALYTYPKRKLWECKSCRYQFSVTSGTIFASRKLPIRDILLAIAIFVNSAKGHSALQLSRDLDVQYRTAFVLSHKIREALAATADTTMEGEVEIDGAYFGGYASSLPTTKKTAVTAAFRSTNPASAAWSSSCASGKDLRCRSCSSRRMMRLPRSAGTS